MARKTQVRRGALALTAAATLLPAAPAVAEDGPTLKIGGTTYTKWLLGSSQEQGAMFNFTTIPGEGYGENGIGTELELLLNARISSQVQVNGRIHSRFSQNFWTNGGGFGGAPGSFSDCVGNFCGEFDPRSNQYIKLRGLAVTLTPGYLVDSATIGANDWGQFDPMVIGRIRYIDRDNVYGVLLQGSAFERRLTWDAARIALPKLFAGPNYSTGDFHATDAIYGLQTKFAINDDFDVGGIFQYAYDSEVSAEDLNLDDGRNLTPRYRNGVGGLKANYRVGSTVDIKGAFYRSYSNADPVLTPKDFGLVGYSTMPAGRHLDNTWKMDVTINDPLDMGLSLNLQGFDIGANYVAVMAARRESDVLLTEGHDGTFAMPGPSNAAFGVFKGNPSRIGYGGWTGDSQQVATISVDNEFTDFDEPFAQSVIGWRGVTANPVYVNGALELSGEYSFITYNTNWQAYGDPTRSVTKSLYPTTELDAGVGHNFRNAFAPFQDKRTQIAVLRGRYVLDVAKGVDLFGKVKYIHENDKRMNDARYLPYKPGACPGGGQACDNSDAGKNFYGDGLSTADIYSNPGVLADGSGYAFKPFESLEDDDRNLNYLAFNLGAGYQVTDDLYVSATYGKFLADLVDGNTAFQAYGMHEMASGLHDKNQMALRAKYILAGVEFGLDAQYAFGTFTPNFGQGYVPQLADATKAGDHNVAEGSRGFVGRNGGWNSLETRHFDHMRLKAFMKAQF